MGTSLTIMAIVQIIIAAVVIFVVIMQEGNSGGMGAISGGADTFFSKNKGKTLGDMLSKWTVAIAIVFVLATVGLNFLVATM